MSRTHRKHSLLRLALAHSPDWKEGHEWTTLDDDHSVYNQYQKFHMKRFARRQRRREGRHFIHNYTHKDHVVWEDELSFIDYDQDYYDDGDWMDHADTEHPFEDDQHDYYDPWDDYDPWGEDYY